MVQSCGSSRAFRALWLGGAAALSSPLLIGAPARAATDAAALADSAPVVVTGHRVTPLEGDTGLATLPTSVRETPQAITVLSGEMLKQQGVQSLEQALRNVPGITIAIGEGGTLNGDQFKIRGFDAKDDVFIDGLRDFGVYTRDSFDYEEVQVLKGPSGALFGRGSVGGAINTVSKPARREAFSEVDGYVGGGDYLRLLGDFNRPIGPNAAVRLNLMASSTGVVDRDHIFSKRYGIAGAAGFGLGTDTTFTINAFHQDDRRRPDYGILMVQPAGSLIARPATEYGLNRSTYLGYKTDADHTRADVFSTHFLKTVNPRLTLTSDTRLGVYSRYFQYTAVDGCTATCAANFLDQNPATIPLATYGGSGPYKQRDWGAQNISAARFNFDVGGFKNDLTAGWDLSYQNNKKTFYAYALPLGFATRNTIPQPLITPSYLPPAGYQVFKPTRTNLFCPATGTANCTTNVTGGSVFSNLASTGVVATAGDGTDYGLFVTDRLYFTPKVSLLFSLREDWYTAHYTSTAATFVTTPLKSDSAIFDPRASLIYAPNKTTNLYVSWGRASTPQASSIVGSGSATTITTQSLEPEVTTSLEAGAKVGVLGGRLWLTASVFDLKKSNATQTDPATGFVQANSGQKQEVKGVELGASGKITPQWAIQAGYTYLDARITEDFSCTTTAPVTCRLNPYTIGRQVTFVPKNAASIWTTYDLDRLVHGLSVGAGVTYQSMLFLGYTSAGTAPYPTGLSKITETPQTLSFDGVITYTVGRYRLALNGYNLADRLNYTQVFGSRAIPSPGRTLIASLGVRF